jgi:hypothetical protein
MGKCLTALLAASALAGGVGCSTTSTLAQASPQGTVQRNSVDAAYVEQVEQLARKRGVRVHWVNAPLRVR